jgi:hypothetical protein
MFKSPNENGQQMLARVLKCFSLYGSKIGYCQGLGFVVGPLLIDTETVFILVRFTEHYGLQVSTSRSTGSRACSHHFPKLCPPGGWNRFDIEPLCFSPWFLSVFAVTCPLLMLLRTYNVLLLEEACKTLMWIVLSL